MRQLQAHVNFLSTNALEPLHNLSDDDLPDGMKEDVDRLVRYAQIQVKLEQALFLPYHSALEQVASSWKERAERGFIRRMVEADVDEKELEAFADDVEQAVKKFEVRDKSS